MIIHNSRSATLWRSLFCAFLLAALLLPAPAEAVKEYLFKTCEQSGFCKRNRHYAGQVGQTGGSFKSPYAVEESQLVDQLETDGKLSGIIRKVLGNSQTVEFPFSIQILPDNAVRFTADEKARQGDALIQNAVRKQRYNETASWALTGDIESAPGVVVSRSEDSEGTLRVKYGTELEYEFVLSFSPFKLVFLHKGEVQLGVNQLGLMNIEHFRQKPADGEPDSTLNDQELDFNMWSDSFQDSRSDSVPKGPESVAVDINFPGFGHVYGIPEHSDSFSLKETGAGGSQEKPAHSQPYRLYNVDIFEYVPDSTLPMYGSIPFLQAHRPGASAGVFWMNAADTYVDIQKYDRPVDEGNRSTITHWMSEAGMMDFVIFLGPNPQSIVKSYSKLTGTTAMPQMFSLGYHQCRWNYNDEADVLDVSANMDKYAIPNDVLWLDIEYTEDKKYFTWKPETFPHPDDMLATLDEVKRKLVAIVDPHIKAVDGYPVYDTISNDKLAIFNSKLETYHGHCWPGESVWIDTFDAAAREYWESLYMPGGELTGQSTNLFLWNDMNEPSVFNGPETTMPKDNVHHGNWEHRDVHNLYGLTVHNSTAEALKTRFASGSAGSELSRPFVLTRSFFAGSQRSAAMWTGDNSAKWEYLKLSLPMVLTMQVSGMPFAGADVGGFFGDPSKELLTRWYQAGIWYPFFRAHAHIDSKRREPWIAGEPYTSVMREAVRIRYSLLPSWYTAFYEAHAYGEPILRPMVYEYPDVIDMYELEDQFVLGSTGLLVKPVVEEGAAEVTVVVPYAQDIYYDYFDYTRYTGSKQYTLEAPLQKIPVLLKAGHILPRKDRHRRSAELMAFDPYTLVVAADAAGNASGSLYVDDGKSYGYQTGDFVYKTFRLADGVLSSTDRDSERSRAQGAFVDALRERFVRVERVVLVGLDISVGKVTVNQNGESWETSVSLEKSSMDGETKYGSPVYVIRDPKVKIVDDWSIQLH